MDSSYGMTLYSSPMDLVANVESGNRNIRQRIHDINTDKGTPAGGYFQIIDPTWTRYAPPDILMKYPTAMQAPRNIQAEVASRIPVDQWGPNTVAALKAKYPDINTSQTLGQVQSAVLGGALPSISTPSPSPPTAGTSVASLPAGFLQAIGATGESAPPKKTTLGALGDVAKSFEPGKDQQAGGGGEQPPQFLNMPPPGVHNVSPLLNAGAASQMQQALGYTPPPVYGTGITSAEPLPGPQNQSLQQLMQMYQQQLGPALYYGYGLDGYGGGYG